MNEPLQPVEAATPPVAKSKKRWLVVVGVVGFIALVSSCRSCGAKPDPFVTLHAPYRSTTHWNLNIVTQVPQSLVPLYEENALMVQQATEDLRLKPTYKSYPIGAVIRKENRDDSGKVVFISEMIKKKPQSIGNPDPWFYRQLNPDFSPQKEGYAGDPGIATLCATCHAGAIDRDYLFHTYRASAPSTQTP